MALPATPIQCLAEFVGTFILVFTVGCNVLGNVGTWAGVSIGCSLMVSIYALGAASGANFNPAVSVALALSKKEELPKMGVYCCVQVIGACVAALCYAILFQKGFSLEPVNVTGAIICELFYTFMLCFVVLNVAGAKAAQKEGGGLKNQFFGLAIGFVVVAGAYGSAPLGAGCFNPAVAIGITSSGLFGGALWCLLYVAIELAGAALAVGAFMLVRPEEKPDGGEPKPYEFNTKLIAEAIGTFALVLTVGLNVLGSSKAAAFSIAASLMCMIYALGDVCGAHFNPAVTAAIQLSGKSDMEPKQAGMYMLAQTGAGILAAFTYAIAHGGKSFALGPNDGWSWGSVMFVELVFTFVLAGVVLCAAVQGVAPEMVGLIVGSCVTVGGFAAGSISGGSLNPAVSMGIAAADLLNGGMFFEGLIYSLAEILGGVAAAGCFKALYGGLLEGLGKQADVEGGDLKAN